MFTTIKNVYKQTNKKPGSSQHELETCGGPPGSSHFQAAYVSTSPTLTLYILLFLVFLLLFSLSPFRSPFLWNTPIFGCFFLGGGDLAYGCSFFNAMLCFSGVPHGLSCCLFPWFPSTSSILLSVLIIALYLFQLSLFVHSSLLPFFVFSSISFQCLTFDLFCLYYVLVFLAVLFLYFCL